MKVNSIFSKKKKRYLFANEKRMLCTNKKTNSSFVLICFQTKIFIDKLQNTELQTTRQTATPVFPSFVSFNSHHPPIFSNWKSTTASTPSKGNVNTLKSYSNDLVSSLQSGLIACPKAERDFYSCIFTCIRFTCRFLSIIDYK